MAHSRQWFTRQELFSAVLASFLVLVFSTASASLIFTGPLYHYLPIGIGSALIGSAIISFVAAIKSQFRFAIAWPHVIQAAFIAIILAHTFQLAAGANLYPTILATIIVSSLSTGLIIFFIGYFKLSYIIRYMPYPVIGGFTAGTGWLIVRGALKMISSAPLTKASLLQSQTLLLYLPGIIFAVLIFFFTKRFKNFLILPLMLLVAIPVTHLILWLAHISMQQAIQAGWLFAGTPSLFPWHFLHSNAWQQIYWLDIFKQYNYFLSMIVIGIVLQLLDISALEVATDTKINFDREIKNSGAANVINACFMGSVANIRFSGSYLTYMAGGRTSLQGIFVSVVCLILLLTGFNFLVYLPKLMITGLLLYSGINILYEWTYDTAGKLPWTDYAIIIVILLTVIFAGILQGVAVGLLVSFLIFIVKYSNISFIKYLVTGETHQSHCQYPLPLERYLHKHGKQIVLIKLQGFIFFGTATNLSEAVENICATNKDLRYLILDFQFVQSIDISTSFSFRYLKKMLSDKDIQLIFSYCNEVINKLFVATGIYSPISESTNIKLFSDSDYAVEWCEQRILESQKKLLIKKDDELKTLFESIFPDEQYIAPFFKHLKKINLSAGSYLFRQYDPADSLYLIASGKVSAFLEEGKEQPIRIYSSYSATIVGEMGFYLQMNRSASVVAEGDCVLYELTQAAMAKIQKEHPEIASAFHQGIIRILAERLTRADEEVRLLNK